MEEKLYYRVNEPDVIYQSFDQEVVAIHLPTGVYHSLPGLGGEVFLALEAGTVALPVIASMLAARYDATRETIERDIVTFVGELAGNALVVPLPGNGSAYAAASAASGTNGPNGHARLPYIAPVLQSFSELQELFLLDPVHDVGAAGWPNLPEVNVRTAAAFRCTIAGPHIVSERFETETVAVNATTGAYYSLYGPAEDVFAVLEHNPSHAEVMRMLASKYELTGIDADAAVREFLVQLKTAGMIEVRSAGDGEAVRELAPLRAGSALPFSTLSFQVFDAPKAAGGAELRQPLTDKQRYRRSGDTLFAHAAGGGVLVLTSRQAGEYHRLNSESADAFALLRDGLTIEELAAALALRYDAAGRDLRAAVMVFVAHMLQMRLFEAADGEAAQSPAPADCLPERRPFRGFDLAVHRDLADLLRPFNPAINKVTPPPANRSTQICSILRQCFEGEARRGGVAEGAYRIAGAKIAVRRAGNFAPELEKPWAHLRSESGVPADLTIHVVAAGGDLDFGLQMLFDKLRLAWTTACGPRGEVLDLHSDRVPVVYHPGPDVLSVVDIEKGEAYYVKRDGGTALPFWEVGSPFRYLLHAWFGARGLQFVHGGAVGTAAGGVLLAGKGGSGKSTTSLLCARAGMSYAGDDYCLADPETGFLHSIYNTGKLKGPDDLVRIPEVAGLSRNEDGFEQGGSGKGIFFLSDLWPERLSAGFPLKAIVIPHVTGEPASRLEPCSALDALLAIVPSTAGQLPGANQTDCDRISRLVSRLPSYILHAGTDLEEIPKLIRGIEGAG